MSKHINVNSGHYKVAGREHQGHDILQASEKGAFAQQRRQARLEALEAKAGPPAWETTPQNLEITDRPANARQENRKAKRTVRRAGKQASKTARAKTKSKTGIASRRAARRP